MSSAEPVTARDAPTVPASSGGAISMLAGDVVARLDFLTVLRVSGADARDFLQGQLTADVDEVDVSRSRLAAWCSPKGRVLAVFRLLADPGGGYRIVCERWVAATLLARLRMFVLRSDVRIDDAGEALAIAGVAGVHALPERAGGWAHTAEVDYAARFGEMTIARVPARHPRFIVTGPPACVGSIASPAPTGVQTASPGDWHLADICAGVPRIDAKSSDLFLPQMLNLDRLHAVSFEKGCYVGQEIVARAQHLGRIKRRAYVGRATAAAGGDPILDVAGNEARKVGDVVAVEPHPDGDSAVFAVLNTESARSPALHVGRSDGAPVRISSPDYMLHPD